MGIKINEYPLEATTIQDLDYYDVDVYDSAGPSYGSRKIKGLTLKTELQNVINPRLYAQTAASTPITNTAVETSLLGTGVGSLFIPANSFKIGDSFTVRLCGPLSCANSQKIDFFVKTTTGVLLAQCGEITLSITTAKNYELNLDFTITKLGAAGVAEIFSNGQFTYNKNSNDTLDGRCFGAQNGTTFDTTIDNTLEITAKWTSANAANSIHSHNVVLAKTY